uniref:Mur ligase central domain-containing protein n=1 Tax=Spongospora subterranea TaxID=70186 RepID=A0A0H5QSU3_9EUKA|eukprot:CRZ05088.1 hypothetical protein [Spongospora subterranea]
MALRRLVQSPAQTLSLGRVQALDRALNSPWSQYPCVHIAGSNGKGSTAGKLARSLSNAGYNTGLFTSPHIHTICERIQVNGRYIQYPQLQKYLAQVLAVEGPNTRPTTFEALTLAALLYFRDQNVDYGVIECGLGGGSDATNIITPVLSVITSISLDHCDILGNTTDEITFAKAGIIKDRIPVITGPTVPRQIIDRIALDHGSTHYHVRNEHTDSSLSYDNDNRMVALRCLEILGIDIAACGDGLSHSPSCRYELIPNAYNRSVIMDAAHNRDGLTRLCQRVAGDMANRSKAGSATDGRTHFIFGMCRDKLEPNSALSVLTGICPQSSVHIVQAANNQRFWPISEFIARKSFY